MPNEPQHARTFRLAEVMRIAAAAAIAGGALIRLGADLDADAADSIARMFGTAALVALVIWASQLHKNRRLDRIEALLDERLERDRRWRAYGEAFADLAGVDGESSTDSGQLPPRR